MKPVGNIFVNPIKHNVMKKIFTFLFAIAFCGGMYAQDEFVLLAPETQKEVTPDGLLSFTNCDLTLDTGSGDQTAGSNDVTARHWNNDVTFLGYKVSKNDKINIYLPDGAKLYRIEAFGFSNGDNWDYVLSYGEDEWGDPEWVDPIGGEVKDNATIQNAVFPVDPCGYVTDGAKTEWTKENAGYTFFAKTFGTPYEGKFTFVISGNNTCAFKLRCWLQKPSGINETKADVNANNSECYNVAGQVVKSNYKGVVLKGNRKYIVK